MNELLWYVSRATGLVSLALLTAVLVLGVVTSGGARPHGERATVLMGLHRWLSLGMVAFLGVHVATAVAETYVSIDAISAVVPFTSSYQTLWVGLGTLAVDLLVAVTVTSWLRHRIPDGSGGRCTSRRTCSGRSPSCTASPWARPASRCCGP